METYQDDSGQWWVKYPTTVRRKGQERECASCGKSFIAVATMSTRFCGRTCGAKHAGTKRHKVHVRGEDNPNWKGGKHVRKRDGYVQVRITNDAGERVYVLEHRYVMAEHLGRELFDYETVHHKNGDVSDNRLENLELHVGRHGRGATEAHCPTCTCFTSHA